MTRESFCLRPILSLHLIELSLSCTHTLTSLHIASIYKGECAVFEPPDLIHSQGHLFPDNFMILFSSQLNNIASYMDVTFALPFIS